MAELRYSQRVDGPNGLRVQVLFYDDGSIRFRIRQAPMAIEEAFLTGGRSQQTIIKLSPRRPPVSRPAEHAFDRIEGRPRPPIPSTQI
jgi:hypothetical protein